MIIGLRKKSQVTIPKEIVNELNLNEGDHLDISIKDGVIIIEPAAVYSKSYIKKLEIFIDNHSHPAFGQKRLKVVKYCLNQV